MNSYVRQSENWKSLAGRRLLRCVVAVVLCMAAVTALAATYTAENKGILCQCRTAEVLRLTSADFDQGQAAQDAAWASFTTAFPGIVDADRVGNRTYTYNCHSYCYNRSDRWLNTGADGLENFYHATGSKCWKQDNSGTVKTLKTGSDHSCLVADNEGKCGALFLCKNNQYVYATMPTDKYKQNP